MAEDMNDRTTLEMHISNLEAKQTALVQEKEKMEEDFGLQRAKLKDLFLQREEELKVKNENLSTINIEMEQLKDQVYQLQQELDEARSQVTIAQCTAENEVACEKRKFEEDIASVRQIMQEEINNAEEEIKELREMVKKYQKGKMHYKELYEKNIEEYDLKRDSLLSPNVLSGLTKSLAKRVPSLSPAHSSTTTLEKLGSQTNSASLNTVEQSENLEESMKRAQEDTALLQSLVIPLEEEITALKEKLREQDAQLRAHESQEQMAIKTAEVIAPLFQGKSSEELVQELDEKLQGVRNTLEVEKASRADLELYTAILNTQKTALADNIEKLREQLTELRQMYRDEKKEHKDLKNTWQRANDQFLEAQRMHLADMRRMKTLLTTEQMKKFHELQRLDSKDDDYSPMTKKSFDNYENASEPPHSRIYSQSEEERDVSEDTVSTVLDSCDGPTEGEGSIDAVSLDEESADGSIPKFNLEKIPQLTDSQKKALSGLEEEKNSEDESTFSPFGGLPSNQRIVSEAEWRKLQREIRKSRSRIPDSCPSCAGIENKLKKSETELKEKEREIILLDKAIKRQKEELDRETLYRKQTEEQWKQKAEEFDKREKVLQSVVEEAAALHTRVLRWSQNTVQSMENKVESLKDKRETAQAELIRLQNENDNLVGKHSQHSQEMQNEIINLPDTMEEMQLLLLKYREDVIAAKVAKEHIEKTSSSDILVLKDQMLQEQHEKTTMENELSGQIESLRNRVSFLEKVERQYKIEYQQRVALEDKLKEEEHKAQEANKRSQQLINGLKQQIDEQTKLKKSLEAEVIELKNRAKSLQRDLENNEAVQRDFVRLSQSLQVELEKIRGSEKEVRWQHEEDIEECNTCKQRFTTVGRRKHHCKHCGKIFCSECVTKSVPSGPSGRLSRVCDVCHTLLVQDATPFFSTEVPQDPG